MTHADTLELLITTVTYHKWFNARLVLVAKCVLRRHGVLSLNTERTYAMQKAIRTEMGIVT